MTEELEKKLNELLGLKKQLEEITANKKKSDTSLEFERKKRKTKIIFYIYLAIFTGTAIYGIKGMQENTNNQFIALFIAIVGFVSTVLMKMWYHTVTTMLIILQEMKEFELRITEMLKK